MKLTDQVCTFEQAQRIDALGLKLDTQFIWWEEGGRCELHPNFNPVSKYAEIYPAPTVAEFGVLLLNLNSTYLPVPEYSLAYWWFFSPKGSICFHGETEAQARAEALIWLLHNGYLKPEDLKL